MPPATARDRLAPYVADIARACEESGVDPYLLSGIILRESGAGWAPGYLVPEGMERHLGWGDHKHAFGLVQADVRYWSNWVHSMHSKTPIGQFRFACGLLRDNWRDFIHSASFAGRDPSEAWRCSVAAYNAGFGRVLHIYVTEGIDAIDSITTGKDYSADVLQRADVLRGEHPGLFDLRPPISNVA